MKLVPIIALKLKSKKITNWHFIFLGYIKGGDRKNLLKLKKGGLIYNEIFKIHFNAIRNNWKINSYN